MYSKSLFYWYPVSLVKVVDGDTLDLEFDLGFSVKAQHRVRLWGVDAPEIHSHKKGTPERERGELCKQLVESWLNEADALFVHTVKDKTGKFGRYLATVTREVGGETSTLHPEKLLQAHDAQQADVSEKAPD